MNVLFIYELNILGSSVVPAQYLYMVGLDGAAFLNNALVGVGKCFREETLPLAIGKGVVVQKLQLPPEIGNQTTFIMDGKVRIPLSGQQTDKFLFKSRFTLKAVRSRTFRRIFSDYSAFITCDNDVVCAHAASSFVYHPNSDAIFARHNWKATC